MACSERVIGFSTGAIAKGDFRRALQVLRDSNVRAVELSALRSHELPELVAALPDLDLVDFRYVSLHAPSRLDAMSEGECVDLLVAASRRQIPIVVHPDVIQSPETWRPLGEWLVIENMDVRKKSGRTAEELQPVFGALPDARFCFDLGHAAQVDPTMLAGWRLLAAFGDRLAQLHVSEVAQDSRHARISSASIDHFRRISGRIASAIPAIVESPVEPEQIFDEIERARRALLQPSSQNLLAWLIANLQSVLDPKRRDPIRVERFIQELSWTPVCIDDFEEVLLRVPHGGPFQPDQVFLSTADLYRSLPELDRRTLREFYRQTIQSLRVQMPELEERYPEVFRPVPSQKQAAAHR